jgi:hypothetical protein
MEVVDFRSAAEREIIFYNPNSKLYQITRSYIQKDGNRRYSYRENLILSNPTF